MRHRKRTVTLSRKAGQRKALVRTLAIALVEHGSVRTTPAKARFVQQFVEPLVTRGKAGDLSARRFVTAALGNRSAATGLLRRSQQFASRAGGYTRITKLPLARAGDGAPQVVIEFVSA